MAGARCLLWHWIRRSRGCLPRERLPKTQTVQVFVNAYTNLHDARLPILVRYVTVVRGAEAYNWLEAQRRKGRLTLRRSLRKVFVDKEHGVGVVTVSTRDKAGVGRHAARSGADFCVVG